MLKLTFTTQRKPQRSVSDLEAGELFKLPKGETAYMKLNNPHIASNAHSAVNLRNGNAYDFEAKRQVVPLEGELFVKEDC